LTKPEVREIAAKMELVTPKEDSRFVFYRYSAFTKFCNKIREKEGAIIQIDKDHSIYSTSQQELSSKNH
jgi:tRNA U34 2-thiouridine synthase MnmA/TrmU